MSEVKITLKTPEMTQLIAGKSLKIITPIGNVILQPNTDKEDCKGFMYGCNCKLCSWLMDQAGYQGFEEMVGRNPELERHMLKD